MSVEAITDGDSVKVKLPAEELPLAVITQLSGSILPGADMNFDCPGNKMLPQTPLPVVMLLEAMASLF